MIEDLLRDEDRKLAKQLDDLKFGSLARKLNKAKQKNVATSNTKRLN